MHIKSIPKDGKISLRRAQMKAALNGNASLLIWLGRNCLGQTDKDAPRSAEGSLADVLDAVKGVSDD